MQTANLPTKLTVQQLYQFIAQLPIEQQLSLAEQIKKQALTAKWQQFIDTQPDIELDISDQEIMAEIKAVRSEYHD